ncbi:NAD-dependent DNA ligase LigA, partial [Candidatus Kaiserbacteria bacterium]|nr:NAD-dependent DNA ligase LigA [Candidatus Kaiserbacteria bacterium]
ISALPGFKEKSAKNLIDAIEKRKHVSLPQLLIALSIDQVGEETAHDLADHFSSLTKIQNSSADELESVSGVGSVVAHSICAWFKNVSNKRMLAQLLQHIALKETPRKKKGKLSGKTFVLTGTLVGLTRSEAQESIRLLGGSISNSVSKKTDYVVTGRDPGTKYNRAQDLGVSTLSEEEFIALMGA